MGLVLLSVLVPVLAACKGGGKSRDAELRALADQGEWKEIEARVEMYQQAGETSPILEYWNGAALLQQDEDNPAIRALDQAVAADSSLAPDVAALYRKAAERDAKGDWIRRGSRRMLQAYLLDRQPQMGTLEVEVAKRLFDDKRYKEVIPIFQDLLTRKDEDPKFLQRWRYLLGRCWENIDLVDAALAEYQQYWTDWKDTPRSQWRRMVIHRIGLILLDKARQSREGGDAKTALSYLDEMGTYPCEADQKAQEYYQKGLSYEALDRPENALESYRKLLKLPDGNAKAERDDARKRMHALKVSGVD